MSELIRRVLLYLPRELVDEVIVMAGRRKVSAYTIRALREQLRRDREAGYLPDDLAG